MDGSVRPHDMETAFSLTEAFARYASEVGDSHEHIPDLRVFLDNVIADRSRLLIQLNAFGIRQLDQLAPFATQAFCCDRETPANTGEFRR